MLAGLLAVGAIEYVGAPPPTSMKTEVARFEVAHLAARITSTDPYEVLGVASDASSDDVRTAYLRLLRSCDPAATTDLELQPIFRHMSNQLVEAFKEIDRRRGAPRPTVHKRPPEPPPPPLVSARVGPSQRLQDGPIKAAARPSIAVSAPPLAAPLTPPSQVSAPPPSGLASPSPVDPSQAIEASARAQDEGRFLEALAILHEAIPHLQGRARQQARVRKAKVLFSIEHGEKLAEEELKLAIAEDPGNSDARVALGAIYQEHGALALAMMEYRKALELQPRNAAARQALQQLGPAEAPASEASVFKRMFGR